MNIFLFLQRRTTGRLLLLLVACTGWMQSYAQQVKSPLQLADQYFAAGEYYTAAYLYEQVLNPPKKQKPVSEFPLIAKRRRTGGAGQNVSRTAILFKQAESYRLANYYDKAAPLYKECAEKDPAHYGDALYWYAVCQRSLGQYAAAEETLRQFLAATATGSQNREAAEKELQTLSYIRLQLARPDSVLTTMQKVNTPNGGEKGAFAPVQVSGNQFLISSTQMDSVQVNGVNPYHSRLFYATLNESSLDQMAPVALPAAGPVNNQGAAAISADGNHLYLSQWKKENGHTVSSIYHSSKQNGEWSQPVLLSSVNMNGYNSKQPFCSKDGKYLFFASDRPGGSGRFDIWYATLNSDGTTGEPVNAGSVINTAGDEQAPFYQNSSNTLVFSSNGRAGMGGYDLFAAKGSETTWKTPENLGHPVNSSRDDIYFFAPEKTALLSNAVFSSDRGEGCCLETYRITKKPKSKQLSGVLHDCKDSAPVADATITLKETSGKTWQTTTDANGRYMFDLSYVSYHDLSLNINKESYIDTTLPVSIQNIDESDLLTDKLTSSELCMEKKPEPVLVIKAEDVVTVYFDFDKSQLKPAALNKLDSIYKVLVESPAATIQISGYTDGRGTEEYNKKLSDRRARACADYLIKKGIDASRVSFVSFGSCCPVEMEIINGRDNADGRSRNRRALINVKKE